MSKPNKELKAADPIEPTESHVPPQLPPYAPGHTCPFVYFDAAGAVGHLNGMAEITLEARRLTMPTDVSNVVLDRVMVAQLRCNMPALRHLRNAIDSALLLAEPVAVPVTEPEVLPSARGPMH
ncbi:hypothetical protein [Beijerinckia sp. L45]|uniref:hypothetical protein n=1 Tax=Beijerinckia sp. L45 TaxID=1641855 RepID=UPI00131DB391|nr:hypothetical protein [Beijerinckia sp. L45]